MMDKYYFYQSYYDALKGLKPSVRYAIRDAIDRYMFEDIEPVFRDTLSNSIWMLLLPTLRKSKIYFANGKLKSKSEANPKQIESKSDADSEICSSKEKEKEKDKGEKERDKEKSASASSPSRFKKPSVDEVRAYIQEHGYHVNPNDFVNFYESKGWLVGRTPMKDWKAAVRTWESKEKNENPTKFVEEKEEFIPITPLERCQVCGSKNVITKGLYSICNGCGVSYRWNNKWVEEN
jgi:hypothetical protein